MIYDPQLTRVRVWLAYGVAAATDLLQIVLGPAGWFVFDEVADVAAMIVITAAIGFHPLLLPTFIIEIFPVVDMIPTWTACVALVLAMRGKGPPEKPPGEPPVISDSSRGEGRIIDV